MAIGNFDGVHLGHKRLVEVARSLGRGSGQRAGVLTFDPHPLHVLHPKIAPRLLAGLDARLERLAAAGAEVAVVVPFDATYARTTAAEFVARDLAGALGVRAIVVGFNFAAGRDQLSADGLAPLCAAAGIALHVVDPVVHHGQVVSSTRVRRALQDGDVAEAAALLGHPHEVDGELEPLPRTSCVPGRTAVVLRGAHLPGPGDFLVRVQAHSRGRGTEIRSALSICAPCRVQLEADPPGVRAELVLPAGVHPFGTGYSARVAFLARSPGDWWTEAVPSARSADGAAGAVAAATLAGAGRASG